jgi:hypothetical protein
MVFINPDPLPLSQRSNNIIQACCWLTQAKADMDFLFTALETVLNAFTFLSGRNVWILPDALGRSLFDFERRSHSSEICEYFGLGIHLIVAKHRGTH